MNRESNQRAAAGSARAIAGVAEKGGFVREAEALLKIAQVLDGRGPEEACAIMAAVSAQLGFYSEAENFLALARSHRASERELAFADASVTDKPENDGA